MRVVPVPRSSSRYAVARVSRRFREISARIEQEVFDSNASRAARSIRVRAVYGVRRIPCSSNEIPTLAMFQFGFSFASTDLVANSITEDAVLELISQGVLQPAQYLPGNNTRQPGQYHATTNETVAPSGVNNSPLPSVPSSGISDSSRVSCEQWVRTSKQPNRAHSPIGSLGVRNNAWQRDTFDRCYVASKFTGCRCDLLQTRSPGPVLLFEFLLLSLV